MSLTIQPSTIRNLHSIAGDAHTALAYGKDVADLLADQAAVRPDEADLLAAAVGVALGVAARNISGFKVSQLAPSAITYTLTTAAGTAAAGLNALRGDSIDTTIVRVILDAMIFQLTDTDEQD